MKFWQNRVLVVQAVTVVVANIALIVVAFVLVNRFESQTRSTSNYANAAVQAALMQADIERLIALGSQDFILALVQSEGGTLGNVPVTSIIEGRALVADVAAKAATIEAAAGAEDSGNIKAEADTALTNLDLFLASPTAENFTRFSGSVTTLSTEAEALGPVLKAKSDAGLQSLRDGAVTGRWLLLAAALVSGTIVSTTTIILGQRLAKTGESLRLERDALVETTESMDKKNNQFRALYQIVSEVSENLSTRYVVATAVREARRLIDADLVALRLLQGDQLVISGVEGAPGLDLDSLANVTLGTGVTGRSAKHGRSMKVESDADRSMSDEERVDGIESGIVVPLIVGARVVGTLGCWSTKPYHFSEDDARILEMMASQVATAVAAADSLEVSVQNASIDALTGLYNRRQLSQDMAGIFADKMAFGEAVSMAMIDIDHFGLFNNDFGHKIGDITLQKVAHVLKSSLRDGDRVYRYGGEEFLVVFNETLEQSIALSERLRIAVAETPLTGERMEPIGPITISVGLAACPEHGAICESISELADQALLIAKKQGRNRIVVWTPELAEQAA